MQRINFLFYGGFFSVDFFLSAREGKNMEEVYCNFHIVQKKAKKESLKTPEGFFTWTDECKDNFCFIFLQPW